jgi:glycosyltransferase involved in cell wall biosynthesis
MALDPLITIITVCYNSEKTISETFDSVINQTFKNIEYIVIDGKSTDGTNKIIQEYESALRDNTSSFKYISEDDDGIYDAMNKGIKIATGSLIGILNSDDWYEPDACEQIKNNYTPHSKYQVIYGTVKVIHNNIEIRTLGTHHNYLGRATLQHQSSFVTKSTYDAYGMFDTGFKYCADYDFFLRVKDHVHFKNIYVPIASFRTDGASDSVAAELERLVLLKKYHMITMKQYYILYMASITKGIVKKAIKWKI